MYTILHIENSEFFRKVFQGIFAKKKINYISAKCIEEARELIQKNEVDLLLTAMEFPSGNVKSFLEELSNDVKYAKIPVFVIKGDEKIDKRKEVF